MQTSEQRNTQDTIPSIDPAWRSGNLIPNRQFQQDQVSEGVFARRKRPAGGDWRIAIPCAWAADALFLPRRARHMAARLAAASNRLSGCDPLTTFLIVCGFRLLNGPGASRLFLRLLLTR